MLPREVQHVRVATAVDVESKHVQISARIPAEMAKALEKSAADNDRSFSAEIRRAIRQYLAAKTD